tara:strand:- start:231 stop:377 length:147 start_codon:yes stop_codon:yes gene_type:complete
MKDKTSLEEIMKNMDRQWTSMAEKRRFEAQQKELEKIKEKKLKTLDKD